MGGGFGTHPNTLLANRILRQLPPDELKSIEPWLSPIRLESNVVLLAPGGAIEQVYFPLSGMISLLSDRGTCDRVQRKHCVYQPLGGGSPGDGIPPGGGPRPMANASEMSLAGVVRKLSHSAIDTSAPLPSLSMPASSGLGTPSVRK